MIHVKNLRVRTSNESLFAHNVSYSTVDGSATAGSDYQSTSGTLSFSGTEMSKPVVLDGDEEIAEYDAAGNVLRRYIVGPAIDDRIARVETSGPNAGKHYYRVNHQGSVIMTTNVAGEISQQTSLQRVRHADHAATARLHDRRAVQVHRQKVRRGNRALAERWFRA